MNLDSYSILCNYFSGNNENIELFESLYLIRPTGELQERIRKTINKYITAPIDVNPFENQIDASSKRFSVLNKLQKDQFQYWCIKHYSYHLPEFVRYAFQISELSLNPIIVIHEDGLPPSVSIGGHSVYSHATLALKDQLVHGKKLEITTTMLNDLKKIYQCILNLDKDKYLYLFDSLSDYVELNKLPYNSSFKILGLIAIIENILTNNKNDSKTIKHQIQNKINLLNNRFSEPIFFTEVFKGSDSNTHDTIIGKIYDFRNTIAHGGKADFGNELKILENKEKVFDILNLLVKRLLFTSLSEPLLVYDLKKC